MNPASTPLAREGTVESDDGSRFSAGGGSPRSGKSLQTLDLPRATMVISSYRNKPARRGEGGNSPSIDSSGNNRTQRLRTKKVIESSLTEENISIYDEVVKDIEDDELSQDTAMMAMSFAQSKVNALYKDKPLPGFIKLRPGAESESESTKAIQQDFEKSLNYPAAVHSAHTMHGKAHVRRGQTGSLYHPALPMTETMRATSPVSGHAERLRIKGFVEPPQDFVATHKLSPIDRKLALTKYGYGRSPKAKAEALEAGYQKKYSDKFISKLLVVESPLARSQHDPEVRLNVAPGSPKSQYLESIEKAEAEKEALRLKKQRQREMHALHRAAQSNIYNNSANNVSSGLTGGVGNRHSLTDSYDEDGRSRADSENSIDHSDVLDHENFNLDDHLNVVEDMLEAKDSGERIDLESEIEGAPGEDGAKSQNSSQQSIMPSDASDTSNLRKTVYTEKVRVKIKEQLTSLSLSVGSEEMTRQQLKEITKKKLPSELQGTTSLSLQGASSQSTGMPLSLGGGSRIQEGNMDKVKQTPAMRKRLKKKKEKAALSDAGGPTRDIVIAPHGKNLDYFKLKNPTKTSASARDPRPGALPQFETPYYHPKDYRLPESLEDKMRNTEAEDDEEHGEGYISLDQYTEAELTMQLPPREDTDKQAWRRNFLGGKKIKFEDAQDTESEPDSQALDAAPDDFDFSVGSIGEESIDADNASQGSASETDVGATQHAVGIVGTGGAPTSGQEDRPETTGSRASARSMQGGRELSRGHMGDGDSLLTTSLAEDSSAEGAEFIPIEAGTNTEAYFPGADPGDTDKLAHSPSDLGKKTERPFFSEGLDKPANAKPAGVDGNTSPTCSVNRGLSASIDLVRASIDSNSSGIAIAPPGEENKSDPQHATAQSQPSHSSASGPADGKLSGPDGAAPVEDGGVGATMATLSHHDMVGQMNTQKEYERTHDAHLHDPKATGHEGQGVGGDGVDLGPGYGRGGMFGHPDTGNDDVAIHLNGNKAPAVDGHLNNHHGFEPNVGNFDIHLQNPSSSAMQRDYRGSSSGDTGSRAPDVSAAQPPHPGTEAIPAANNASQVQGDDASLNTSTSSQKNARHLAAKRREQEEIRKTKAKEAAKARKRAQKLARLQEEQANKTMKFLQKHADPETAKRIDYVFPDHGIQKPGVGEARIKHRDYAYDSMYLNKDGSLQSQKDEHKSSLLDTVLQDVRLKSPIHGEDRRPMTPSERHDLEASLHLVSFRQTFSGSVPPTPDNDHRNIRHQIQILQNTIRENERFVAEPDFVYDDSAGFGKPDQNDMSQPNFLTASQRFRIDAEKQREIREKEALLAAERRAHDEEEREKKALQDAGFKEPKRKKLQRAPKKVQAEPIPIAYAVGGNGASIVPSRVPSRVRKPKKHFSNEQSAEQLLSGVTLARKPKPKGTLKAAGETVVLSGSQSEPKIKISGGVAIHMKDNRALDPEGFSRREREERDKATKQSTHMIWGTDEADEVSREQLSENLQLAMSIRSRSSRGGDSQQSMLSSPSPPGSAAGKRRVEDPLAGGASQSTIASGDPSTARPNSPGSPGAPGVGQLTQESTLSLNSGNKGDV